MSEPEQPPAVDVQPDEPAPSRRALAREWARALLLALLIVAPFRSAVADWNDVPTGSMRPTIEVGDRIVVDKRAYGLRVPFTTIRITEGSAPERGDVVVLLSPVDGTRLVKRVAAVPGDLVELRAGRLWIDGEPAAYEALGLDAEGARVLLESVEGREHRVRYERGGAALRDLGPLRIPPDRFLVLGDNRDASADSRVFGLVERDAILGRAVAVAFSLDLDAWRVRWDRWFEPLD